MAIMDDRGQLIFYHCPELKERIKKDCQNSRRRKTVYAACRKYKGVKIVFNYVYNPKDKEEMSNFPPLSEDEWFEKTTLGKLLAYVIQQDSVDDEYDNINDLFDSSGMSITEFAKYFSIPMRTVQDWIYGNREIADYMVKLLNYKLKNEKMKAQINKAGKQDK